MKQARPKNIRFHFGSSFMMQGIARAVAPELARGVSTAIALRANKEFCAPCHCSPTFKCPEFPRLPDCNCLGSSRQCPSDTADGAALFWPCLVALLIGIIFGLAISAAAFWWLKGRETYIVGTPVRGVVEIEDNNEPRVDIFQPELSAAAKALARRR